MLHKEVYKKRLLIQREVNSSYKSDCSYTSFHLAQGNKMHMIQLCGIQCATQLKLLSTADINSIKTVHFEF